MEEKIDWLADFKQFIETEEAAPPRHVSQAILSRVKRELNPSQFRVLLKAGLCAALAGMVSLTLCPQFGLGFMRESGLHMVFMHYLGPHGCTIACGAFFSFIGLLAAVFILRPEELRVLRANKYLALSVLTSLFLASFVCLGDAVFLESAILWFIGAWLGGLLAAEGGSTLVFSYAHS